MTNEERDLISKFVARVSGGGQGGFSRAVPTTGPSLPPIDLEADRYIAEQFQAYPEARYRITQMAVVPGSRVGRGRQPHPAIAAGAPAGAAAAIIGTAQSKGFFGGLFGGGAAPQQSSPWNQGGPQQQYAPPQQPQYATPPNYPPNMQPGMFRQGGSGFLGSALSTAAGVAGGVVGANLLMDMFSGHSGAGGGGLFGGGVGGGAGMPQETIINNNYGDAGNAGGWDNNAQSAPDAGWDNSAPDNSGGGWDDNSAGGGGGWDDNSNT